jgi:hypothetical protein
MFDDKSRYKKLVPYEAKDRRERKVMVIPVPDIPNQAPLGRHLLQQGQRLDHLAKQYLNDPTGYWRICEMNGVMKVEELTESHEIVIPVKNNGK